MLLGKCKKLWALVAVLAAPTAFAFDCHPYEDVTGKLASSYKEQLMFSGFADSDSDPSASAIYELWVNPDKGNWSLVTHRVFLFQRDAATGVIGKSCATIVSSGKRHDLLSSQPVSDSNPDAVETLGGGVSAAPAAVPSPTINSTLNCIPRDRHARALKDRYNEVPIMRALSEDDTVLEIYGSGQSWTITQAKIREVRNTLTGRPLTDEKTGQKIHQLCSDPAYSGKTWTMFEPSFSHI